MTRAAGAVHAAVLRDAGYVRDGRRCRRRDFIVREVMFDAHPYREVWERAVLPSFDLSWIDLTARPAPVVGRTTIGIGLPGAPLDMPPLDVS